MFMKSPNIYSMLLLSLFLGACSGGGGGGGGGVTGDITGGGSGGGSTPTTDWVTRSLGFSSKITAATWNGTKYLAISDAGKSITSTDGINWNTSSPASGAGTNDVVWGNNMFVSTGSFAQIKTSPDGITWTFRSRCSTCFDDLYAVAWSGSLFIAAGEGGRIYTSSDGISWTLQTSNATTADTFWDVAASATAQVAVGSNNGGNPLIRYSTDGITWNTPIFNIAPTSSFNTAIWTGSQFVITGGNGIYTSTNGASWIRIGAGIYTNGMAWDGSKYIATSISGAMTSTDLTSWSSTLSYINHSPTEVIYVSGLNQYLLVGDNDWTFDSGWVATSTDATNWTVRVGSDPKNKVIWDGSKFIALDSSGRLFTSVDGLDWSSTSGITMDYASEVYKGLAYSPSLNRYVAASGNKIVSSEDGVSWTTRQVDTFMTAQSVIWTGSKFIMAGWNGRYLVSTDGITWNRKDVSGTITTTPHLSDVAWSSSLGRFVVITASLGNIFTSTNEITWTELASAAPNGLYGIVWTGSSFVAVGRSGTIVTSSDGINWSNRSITSSPTLYDVNMIAGKLVAVGTSGKVYVSIDDGINWTAQTTDTTNTLLSVAASPTREVVVGNVGTVIAK